MEPINTLLTATCVVSNDFWPSAGATYRITDYLSAFAGVRMNYVSNGYEGHIRNIEANIGGGEMVNVNKYFSDYAKQARTAADAYLAANDLANYAKI